MKIAFIRSVSLQQANPTLRAIKDYAFHDNIELKLFYTDGDCNSELFPGDFEKVSEDIGPEELCEKIIKWEADAVISISLPDNNAHRDSYLKELLEEQFNIPVIMHPVSTTTLLSNKWETNQWLKRNGYKVPKSILVYGDLLSKRTVKYVAYIDFIISKVKKLKKPYFLKPLWDSMSTGVLKINDINELKKYLYDTNINCDFVIEEQVNGGLYGMEVVGNNGNYFCQPLVKKCTGITDSLVPFDHVRFGPFPLNNDEIIQLENKLIKICNELKICGSVEFEFIRNEKEFYIIEINPRVSGMTNLSSAISGLNTYTCLLQMAQGRVCDSEKNPSFTLELPLENMTVEKFDEISTLTGVHSINHVVYHNGTEQYKMLFQVNNLEEACLKLSDINKHFENIPNYVFEEIKQENLVKERELV
ncbi:ATP-grasp domain-containing protein [Priestia megaterium]|uniref:ATP-grasp domain-containing protein n=1 Tax=Priestia megaterium TaxID=1404 RepID=UPI0017870F5B|nr:ATP-grasp domain-containing protein [Priestia megaterium]MBD8847185.1 ATP-grasp domain-containing protein [Priestia megaterium]